MVSRTQIVEEARKWKGTVFHHQGRLICQGKNKGGVDCIGLLVGVCKGLAISDNAGVLLHQFDRIDYAREPQGNLLRDGLSKHFTNVEPSTVKAGDILLFKMALQPQHIAIVTDVCGKDIFIIHAWQPVGKVVEHRISGSWINRIVAAYSFDESILED